VAGVYRDFDEVMAHLTPQAAAIPPPASESWTAGDKPAAIVGLTQPAVQQNRPVVRVSLEKLDDLANIVRGLVTSRSVFEQRLAELELQVQELHNTTHRLQRSSSKLETDFEANMLGRTGSGAQLRGVPASLTNSLTDNEFDMLEFDRYTEFHQTTRELLETTSDSFAINSALDTLRGNLEGLFENQRLLIEEMQDKLQRIRMIEFGTLSARLSRTIRVTCEEEEKQADLFISGENLEIDTQILDALIEPLMHLLRNAVAHGIESPDTRRMLGKPEKGRIELAAVNEETHIAITITDDGRGITTSALKEKAVQNGFISRKKADSLSEDEIFDLMFQPGLTTAESVSQTAGRGVGMNIVRTSIERQQGTVTVSSDPQKGTSFTLRLPISMAVTRVLFVKANRQIFAFPLKLVREIKEIKASDLEKTGERSIRIGNTSYPLADLNEQLGFPGTNNSMAENHRVLLLDIADRQTALIVDEIIKPEEIVIKPLGRPLENLKGLLGATIRGNGQVVPVLDMPYLLDPRSKRSKTPRADARAAHQISVLVVDDSPSVRHLNTRLINNAGWKAVVAKDGQEAIEMLQAGEKFPDVILTDVEMPRMDGYELLSTLKKNEQWKDIPVVMITSRAGDKHRQKAVELGATEYLVKPYEDTQLLELIKKLTL
jgi:chemosensory pili system protein ChpA (sensor histidine kinase/response regulator)